MKKCSLQLLIYVNEKAKAASKNHFAEGASQLTDLIRMVIRSYTPTKKKNKKMMTSENKVPRNILSAENCKANNNIKIFNKLRPRTIGKQADN